MMTGMILIDLQKAFGTIDHDTMTCYCKSYLLLISRNILLIGLSLISPSDLFWLIQEIIFLDLHLSLRNGVLYVLAWVACLRGWRASVRGVGGVLAWVTCQRGWCACVGGVLARVVCLRGWRASVLAWVVWLARLREQRASVSGVLTSVTWLTCQRG